MRKYILLALVAFLFSACSKDYTNVIPSDSIALMAIDARQPAVQRLIQMAGVEQSGLDFSEPLYGFETRDGLFGVVAKVDNGSSLEKWLTGMADGKTTERKGFRFMTVHDTFVAGFDDHILMVVGPVVGAAQGEAQRKMLRYLEAGKATESKLFERLQALEGPVTLVARCSALPERLVAPFTLGTPKDTDPDQVLIAAAMTVDDNRLDIEGETFSFNPDIDKALRQNVADFRPIDGDYATALGNDALFGLFANVEGGKLLEKLRANKDLSMLLTGFNTTIDMDNIIRSVDGDVAFVMPDMNKVLVNAKVKDTAFLDDVDYWKKSSPQGVTIVDQGKNTYAVMAGSERQLLFGISGTHDFFAYSQEPYPGQPLPLKGKRMYCAVNLRKLDLDMINNLFGGISYVTYTMKTDGKD